MDIALVTPPTFADSGLLMACPALAGFLEARGIDVCHLDLNSEFPEFLNGFVSGDTRGRLPARLGASALRWWLAKRPRAKQYEFCERAESNWNELLAPPPETYHHLICTRFSVFVDLLHDRTHNPYYRYFEARALPRIVEGGPLVLGISVISPTQLLSSLTLAAMVRHAGQDTFIVFGGPYITVYSDEFSKSEEICSLWDGLVLDEGETPLYTLCRVLKCGGGRDQLADVPNFIFKRNGTIEVSSIKSTEDLNALPTPRYATAGSKTNSAGPIVIQASRQCYWRKCRFCVHVNSFQRSYRCRRASLVLEDILKLHRTLNATRFFFADVSISPSQLKAISAEILQGCDFIPHLSAFIRFSKALTPKLLQQCAAAGLRRIHFGLETVNERLSNLMLKGHEDLETVNRTLEICHGLGIEAVIHAIFGFPTETERETMETYHYLLERQHLCEPIVEVFRIEKGTPIFNEPKKFEIEILRDARLERFNNSFRFRQLRPGAITTRRAQELRSRFYLDYWGKDDALPPPKMTSVPRLKEGARLTNVVFNYDNMEPAAQLRLPLIMKGETFQPVSDVAFQLLKCMDGRSSLSTILEDTFEVAEEDRLQVLRVLSAMSPYLAW